MDIPLFGLALLTFAILYLGLSVFLLWTLVITGFILMAWLAIRWRAVGENYPHGLGDSLTLLVLVSITWILFVFLGPKECSYYTCNGSNDGVPFMGNGLTYIDPPWHVITEILIFFIFLILILFAVIIPVLQHRMTLGGGGGGDEGGGKGKVGVGAG
ncbi:MAG: hypothetical protein KGJ23_14190 [Euryarchaeota archaeon]|nr:hypothetical protein [Euryarchaeota archaeon]MDE1837749.1 hypothetical protein [Euryarchaeota archaeon]MDE1881143.1 hypothetical protein [Euryarchaeota archaeon]MDE2045429.1 hypothetical protein [Thermoplasmata archaeon]